MKKKEVHNFVQACENNAFSSIRGTKFVYAIHRNMAKFQSLNKSIIEMGQPADEFKPFLEAQWKLFEKYGEKLPSGQLKVISVNGKFDVTIPEQNQKQYHAAEKILNIDFKDTLAKYNEFNENYKTFLDSEIEPQDLEKIHTIKFEDLPDNLTFKQLELLNFMIIE